MTLGPGAAAGQTNASGRRRGSATSDRSPTSHGDRLSVERSLPVDSCVRILRDGTLATVASLRSRPLRLLERVKEPEVGR